MSQAEEIKEKTKKIDEELGRALDAIDLAQLKNAEEKIKKEINYAEYSKLSDSELIELFYLKRAEIAREMLRLQAILDTLRKRRNSEISEGFLLELEEKVANLIAFLDKIEIFPLTLPDKSYFTYDCNQKDREKLYEALTFKLSSVKILFFSPRLRIYDSKQGEQRFFDIYDSVTNEDCRRVTMIRDDEGLFVQHFDELMGGIRSEIGYDFVMDIKDNEFVFYYKKCDEERFGREIKDELSVKVGGDAYKIPITVREGERGGLMVAILHKDWLSALYEIIRRKYKEF